MSFEYFCQEFACFSIHLGLLSFINFSFSNRTPKMTRILTMYQSNEATLMSFSKEEKHFDQKSA